MKSLILLGGFLVSTAITAAGNLAHPAADTQPKDRPVRAVTYEIFRRPVEAIVADKRPDSITVVTMAKGEGCVFCDKLKPELDRLRKEGYKVTEVHPKDWKPAKGQPQVTRYPTIIFMKGDKVVRVNEGYLDYKALTRELAPVKKEKRSLLPFRRAQ